MPANIRTALVGCGKVGRIHANALASLPQSDFSAVCDADIARARTFADEFGVAAYTDVESMVKERGIQAAFVCTPHPLHAASAVPAVEAGAHVMIEKPLAASLADCDRILDATRRAGVQVGMVSQRRFFPPVQRMKAAIDAGQIGRPVLGMTVMLSWRDEAYYRSDPWRGKWDTEGGGVLINQSPHQFDLLQWLMGPIEEISGYWANLNHPFVEVDDTAVATIRFREGGLGSIVTSLSQKPGIHTNVHIHGSNGASVGVQTDTGATFVAGVSEITEPPLNDIWTIPGEEHLLEQFRAEDRGLFAGIRATEHFHALQIAEFLEAIRDGRPTLVTGEDGRKVVEMIAAIYQSNRERRPVKIEGRSSDAAGRLS